MSNVLNNPSNFTDSNSQLTSQGAYTNMLNRNSANLQGPNLQGPNLQGPNLQGPNMQTERDKEKYSFHSALLSFADAIEFRFKERSDNPNDADEEIADSTMTESEIRQQTLNIFRVSTVQIFIFFIVSLCVIFLPIFFKGFETIIIIVGAVLILSNNFFFLYITMNSRQFVVGPSTEKLYKLMVKALMSMETGMFLISTFSVSFAISITYYTSFHSTNWIIEQVIRRASQLEAGRYSFEIVLFYISIFAGYVIIKKSLFKKYKIISLKRKRKMDSEILLPSELALRVQEGYYSFDD